MTKQHFIKLAELFQLVGQYAQGSDQAEHCLRLLANGVATFCQDDNPAFDRQRFLSACHLPDSHPKP